MVGGRSTELGGVLIFILYSKIEILLKNNQIKEAYLHLDSYIEDKIHIIMWYNFDHHLAEKLNKSANTLLILRTNGVFQANKKTKRSRSLRKQKEVSLSKTKEWGQAIDSEHLSEITEEELEVPTYTRKLIIFFYTTT